jgi:hypothetical protein
MERILGVLQVQGGGSTASTSPSGRRSFGSKICSRKFPHPPRPGDRRPAQVRGKRHPDDPIFDGVIDLAAANRLGDAISVLPGRQP